MFYGPGAGKLPTASAVVADIIDIISGIDSDIKPIVWSDAAQSDVLDMADYACKRVFIVKGSETPKALADIEERHALEGGLVAVVTEEISESEAEKLKAELGETLVSAYRVL